MSSKTPAYSLTDSYVNGGRIWMTLLALFVITVLLTLNFISIWNRKVFPLRFRSTFLSSVMGLSVMIENFFTILVTWGVIPCEYHRVLSTCALVMQVTSTELYIFRVYYQTRIMQGSLSDLPNFLKKFQIINSNYFFFGIVSFHLVLYIVPWLVLCMAPGSTYPDWQEKKIFPCTNGPSWGIYWVLVLLVESTIILVWLGVSVYRSLKGVADTLYFKRDLKFVCFFWGLTTAVYLIVSGINDPIGTNSLRVLSSFVQWFSLAGLVTITTLTNKRVYEQVITPSDLNSTLLRILSSDVKRDFIVFLKSEWTYENLLFYEEVEKFKQKTEHDLAVQIYETYVRPSAPRQVNLDGDLIHEIQEQLELGVETKDTFNRAQQQALTYMTTESLPRFMRSKNWSAPQVVPSDFKSEQAIDMKEQSIEEQNSSQ